MRWVKCDRRDRLIRPAGVLVFFLLASCSVVSEQAGTGGAEKHTLRSDPSQVFYLYLPPSYSPDRPWPVMVSVHGSDGDGRSLLLTWEPYADADGFVLISPTFPPGYNQLAGGEDEKLLAILDQVGETIPLQDKVFLVGFSGGGQFVHRFAFRHAARVLGASVMSAGQYDTPPPHCFGVPFLVTVGEGDSAEPDRVSLARAFVEQLEAAGCLVEFEVIPGVDHWASDRAVERTVEFFRSLRR